MNVSWITPDGATTENAVPDVEQLLLLLRLVNGVTLEGTAYRVADSRLVVSGERMGVVVSLLPLAE
ncbi:hypothetical protein [Cohnella sp. GCM10027633]|uniref:hypothetical protein n=1 Tax=unclassified Cohnella TaxID=2636738 RepID=UPI003627850D